MPWTLDSRSGPRLSQRSVVILGALGATVVALAIASRIPPEFVRERWLEFRPYGYDDRSRFVRTLCAEDAGLIGLTEARLVELLGEPNEVNDAPGVRELVYDVGARVALFPVRNSLRIGIEGGKVVHVRPHPGERR